MATAPKHIAADLADAIFGAGPKVATGEMSQAELDAHGREEWPLHYAIADALGGTVKPFDQYQGPYIDLPEEGRLFIYSDDGATGNVWNEDTKQESETFLLHESSENEAVDAALSVCENPDMHIKDETRAAPPNVVPYPDAADPSKHDSWAEPQASDDGMLTANLDGLHLNSPLEGKSASLIGFGIVKTADGSMLGHDDQPSADSKLQRLVGDPMDQPISAFAQFYPNVGTMQMPNPLSPVEGDAAFFTYMLPGAVFQSHDGQQWVIEDYNGGAYGVQIYNRWYPRLRAWVNLDDVRRSIHSWVEPVQTVVPPPPPGVNYIGQPVRIVDGKSHA